MDLSINGFFFHHKSCDTYKMNILVVFYYIGNQESITRKWLSTCILFSSLYRVYHLSEAASLPSQGRSKVYVHCTLPSSDPTLWDYTSVVVYLISTQIVLLHFMYTPIHLTFNELLMLLIVFVSRWFSNVCPRFFHKVSVHFWIHLFRFVIYTWCCR